MTGKIVIVDDDPDDVLFFADELKRRGYTVDVLDDPEDALEYVRTRLPDLLIVDILLPKMDGTDLVRSVHGEKATRGLPVIFLTGLKRHCETGGLESGEAVFPKPVSREDVDALCDVVRRTMSRARL